MEWNRGESVLSLYPTDEELQVILWALQSWNPEEGFIASPEWYTQQRKVKRDLLESLGLLNGVAE